MRTLLLFLGAIEFVHKGSTEDAGGQGDEANSQDGDDATNDLASDGYRHHVAVSNRCERTDRPPKGGHDVGKCVGLNIALEVVHQCGGNYQQ